MMWPFGKKKPKKKPAPRADTSVYVRVKFADLSREPSPTASRYTYRWTLPFKPSVGYRVIVPGLDGGSPAVVVGVGNRRDYSGEILSVIRMATPREIENAHRAAERRREVGRAQWRAMQGASTGRSGAVGQLGANLGPGGVRGRHYTEWVEPIKQMKRDGNHGEAVALLRECQAATIRADRGTPAPWYFEQEAIIHRKEKQYAAEVAALERYFAACAGVPKAMLAERYGKARELASGATTNHEEKS